MMFWVHFDDIDAVSRLSIASTSKRPRAFPRREAAAGGAGTPRRTTVAMPDVLLACCPGSAVGKSHVR
jgi:hypothetical protein